VRPGDSGRDFMADVTWLTGFGGSSGLVVVGQEARYFVTDFRYTTTAADTVPSSFQIVDATAEMIPTIAGLLAGRVGLDESKTSLKSSGKLLEAIADDVEIVGTEDLVADLRRIKDETEIALIAEAARITDEAYAFIEERGLAGRTEREVALATEAKMRELGASDPSFASIVAAGPNGALPHAEPGDRVIEEGEYVVVDMGAIFGGYCSDCTRTLVDGDPDPVHRQAYELVLAAQLKGLEAIRAGANGREVDAVARAVIDEAGFGERFGHGLGHGVGIEVHEAPRLSKRSDDTLVAGDVVTVEPGVYLPGEFGIRIEDLVVVTDDGCRNLSSRPK
jgi:Xaa-Pro aminopeptidase